MPRHLCGLGPVFVACCLASAASPPPSTRPIAASAGAVLDQTGLAERLGRLAALAPQTVELTTIGRSLEDREIRLLRIARPGKRPADRRTAILIVAGLDATRPADTETALRIAEALVKRPAAMQPAMTASAPTSASSSSQPARGDWLADHTLYILPRVNPDGVERFLGAARDVNNANARPIDDDRDGVPDDDPPEDLNGDGLITQMRVRDPEGAYLPDPDEPRLLRKADRAKGERPVFTLYTEGLDNDGDGEYNEDGLGGTDLNRNFPHAYPELAAGAGENELSEPESLALADFVLNHPNIAAVIVYGRHDNIVHLPGDKQRDVSGRGYRDLHPDDTPIYRHLSERFKELTGLEDGPKRDNAGSFYTWVYNQRGLPVAATTLWWVPKAEKPEKPNASAASQPAATQPATTQPTTAPAGASSRSAGGETPTTGPTSKPENETRKDRPGKAGKPKAKGKGKDPLAVDRRWLRYSDEQRDGAGFVDWQPYEHPTLGRVEIGGFAPGFRENPPPAALSEIVKQQLDWIDQLAAWLPNPRIACCTVERKTESVYAVELSIVNEGYLPTALAMARTARVADPFVFRLDLPAGDVLGGRRVAKVPWLGGMGATRKVRWLVRGQPGQEAIVHVYHKRFGSFDYAFHLKPTATEDK